MFHPYFIVAPIGKTKLATSSSTPICSVTLSIVTGRVAALELVENASNCAGEIAFIKKLGLFFVKIKTRKLYIIIIKARPINTVKAYQANALNKSTLGDSAIKDANNAKTPYGAANIIRSTIFKITSFKPSKKLLTVLPFSSGIKINPIPKKNGKENNL